MVEILTGYEEITDILKKYLIFLGPNLKAVTGNADSIEKLVKDVKALVHYFESSPYDFFLKINNNHWK